MLPNSRYIYALPIGNYKRKMLIEIYGTSLNAEEPDYICCAITAPASAVCVPDEYREKGAIIITASWYTARVIYSKNNIPVLRLNSLERRPEIPCRVIFASPGLILRDLSHPQATSLIVAKGWGEEREDLWSLIAAPPQSLVVTQSRQGKTFCYECNDNGVRLVEEVGVQIFPEKW